jgi:NO-binding membrane sensor protein with MHYT domain
LITVNNFSNGLASPVLGYAVSCLGAFLRVSCVTRARYYHGLARARWLGVAATAIGATGIWAMHFIAMLGFAVPGQEISYNVPITIASMLIAIGVVGVGLLIVGFGDGGLPRLLAGGLIVGTGVAAMHYLGMAALVMSDSMSYSGPLHVRGQRRLLPAAAAARNHPGHLRPHAGHQPVADRGRDQRRRRVQLPAGNAAGACRSRGACRRREAGRRPGRRV